MTRRPHDQYFTPASACEVLKAHWDGWKACDVLVEPCVGLGDIVKSFPEKQWITNDIDPSINAEHHEDAKLGATHFRWTHEHRAAKTVATITNPPFSCAYEILIAEMRHSQISNRPIKLAMLLRLSFLEPTQKRGQLLSMLPPRKVIVLPRISFTGDGKTDSVTCAWMIWDKDIKDKGVIVSPKP